MSAIEDTLKITGIEVKGNLEGNPIVNIYNTTNFPAQQETKDWQPFCTVTAPTPNFAGREDLIATIHRQIQQCSLEKEYSKKLVVIHGLGGIGKSELVRKYVQMYRQDPIILNAAWIDAESENSLKGSFKSLAQELNLQTQDREVKDVVSSVYKHLADHNQPSLFIFDNAEQMRCEGNVFGIFDFLPTVQLDTVPLLIITTRFKDWEIPEENILQINELSDDAGIEFLIKRFKLSQQQKSDETIMDALKNLAYNLQCFPLGLTLAASNIPHSKLRSIPTEIEAYIQKLNLPHGDWIHERHSVGTASKYDLIMNNVWAATLEKMQSQGRDGEAANFILNIISYLPPDKITVEDVVKVAEFSGHPNSTAGIEMLELYSLISLPSSTLRYADYQLIRIHRLVQRCTRDKLDREENYTHLSSMAMFLVNSNRYPEHLNERAVHQLLKERMWPENSINFSILLACSDIDGENKFEILKDVHEALALALKAKPCYAHDLSEEYKLLHALNLFYLSTCSKRYTKLCQDLILKDPSYSMNYLEQAFVSTMGKCVQGLFMGTMDMEDLVNRATFDVLITTFDYDYQNELPGLLSERARKITLMLADATRNSFEGRVEIVGQLYRLLSNIYWSFKPNGVSWYVELVLKIHGSVYASISETEESRLDSYWEDDRPIRYEDILHEPMDNLNADWNRSLKGFVEPFCTEAGLQFLLQHLQYVDALTQTKTDPLPPNARVVLELITFMGWKWHCTKEFVQVNLFMETLYSITKNIFKLNIKDVFKEQFLCLLVWFGLIGKNTYVDRNGVSWSIQSVEKELILFLDTFDSAGVRLSWFVLNRKLKAIPKEFTESSGSNQESIAVRTATRMLEC